MRLNHNLNSLNIYRTYTKDLSEQSLALGRISSGSKINSAKEGASQIGQSELLRVQIRGLQAAQKNTQDGASMMQTFDGALDSITSALDRIKELTVQAGNGSYTPSELSAIQKEIDQLKDHVNTTSKDTEFNGVKLLDNKGSFSTDDPVNFNMMSGANVGENIKIPMYNLKTNLLGDKKGNTLDKLDVTDPSKADSNMSAIDNALKQVIQVRGKYGALQQRFESTTDNSSQFEQTLQGAESSIRDADLAEEMLGYSKSGILVKSSIAMMAQSNNFPQEVLQILQGIK